MSKLANRHCSPCDGDTPPLSEDAAKEQLALLSSHWSLANSSTIRGEFKFKNYYETQAFVNAVAYIAHREDHHPDITFGYNNAAISLTTHAVDGLSDNDFISAAKVDQLLE